MDIIGFEKTGKHDIDLAIYSTHPYDLIENNNGHYIYRFYVLVKVSPQAESSNDMVSVSKMSFKVDDEVIEFAECNYNVAVYYSQRSNVFSGRGDVRSSTIAYSAEGLGHQIDVDFNGYERIRISEISTSDKVITLAERQTGLDMLVPKGSSTRIYMAFNAQQQGVWNRYDHLVVKYILDGTDEEYLIGTGRVSFQDSNSTRYDDFVSSLDW